MSEWNLSDKINFSEDVGKGHNYYEEDIQEFIRRLKEAFNKPMGTLLIHDKIIDQLAGEKLISPQILGMDIKIDKKLKGNEFELRHEGVDVCECGHEYRNHDGECVLCPFVEGKSCEKFKEKKLR